MSQDLAALRAQAKPYVTKATVCVDGELVAELETLQEQIREGEGTGMLEGSPGLTELQDRAEQLARDIEEKSITLRFKSIGRANWRKIELAHPATEEQREEDSDLELNPETYPKAALKAASLEPKLSDEDVDFIVDDLSEGEFQEVWGACIRANIYGADPKKVLATAATARTAKK